MLPESFVHFLKQLAAFASHFHLSTSLRSAFHFDMVLFLPAEPFSVTRLKYFIDEWFKYLPA